MAERLFAAFALLLGVWQLEAQLVKFDHDQMLKYTAKSPFERFPDGRPKVPDDILEKMKALSAEDVYGVLMGKGFRNQYEGNWQVLHPGRKLVGRAFTVQFMPVRNDVMSLDDAEAKAKGLAAGSNQRAIDMLQAGDVVVVDLNGKYEESSFVGDNLAHYIMRMTGTGMVIDGGIRDLEGIAGMDMSAYFRGVHPGVNRVSMLTGINVPVRIGNVTVMPGDVVLGDREGVYFIPPEFAKEVVDKAEETRIHDEWTKMKFDMKKYKSSEVYGRPTRPELIKEYEEYLKSRLGKK